MLILLSPSKTLDFSSTSVALYSHPAHLERAARLIEVLRGLGEGEVASLMKVSDKIAALNVQRYQDFSRSLVLGDKAKQALLAFKGDVYKDWPLEGYEEEDFAYAQAHLRILSGLYGALRPMDLIQPYRLEMGTRLATEAGQSLYEFWGDGLSESLREALEAQGDDLVVNLASQEYFNVVREEKLGARVVSPVFQDKKPGKDFKIIAFYAKRARGMMAHYLLKERVEDLEGLRAFSLGGYKYDASASTALKPMFRRVLPA